VSRKKGKDPEPEMSGFPGQSDEAADAVDGLNARQAKALEALLQEPTMTRAAAAGGVNERTLRRWLAEPAFRDAVFRARREAFGQAIWLTQRYAAVAVATLVKVMQDQTAPPSAKVSAAAMVLKFGREGMELDDLAERVETLERGGAGAAAAKTPAKRRGDNGSADDTNGEDHES
jgi:hypothetical protein